MNYRPAHWGPELRPEEIEARRVQILARRERNLFLQMPTEYVDLIHAIVGAHGFLQIIVTGGSLRHFLQFGVCTIYAYGRIRRIGGTRKKITRKGTQKGGKLGLHEFAIIEARDPTVQFIQKVENKIGKKAKFINYNDLPETLTAQ
jgi:hypothetical protein